LRVVMTDRYLRLVAYAPLPVFHWVSVTSTWLSTAADRAPDPEAGVRVAPGVSLSEIERLGPMRKVRGFVDGISFDGWVREEVIGKVFVPERFPRPPTNGLLESYTKITS